MLLLIRIYAVVWVKGVWSIRENYACIKFCRKVGVRYVCKEILNGLFTYLDTLHYF